MPAEWHIPRAEAEKFDTRCDVRVARLAAEEWGVLSLAELLACGLSDDAITSRVQNGRLHRLHCGVYAVGHVSPPLEGRFLAAVKASGPNAVLSHFAAAAHLGLLPWDEDRYPEVTVHGTTTRRHRGIRVHRTCEFHPKDIRQIAGVPCTSPARVFADIAATMDYRPLRRAVRQALSMGKVSLRQLAETTARLGPRRGSRNLTRIIATAEPTRSDLEDIVLDLILNAGLGRPDVNAPLVIDGRRLTPDFRWPAQRLIVEADGGQWHENKLAREDDAERQALLEAHGERLLRVTWKQAIAAPAQTLRRLRAAGAPEAD